MNPRLFKRKFSHIPLYSILIVLDLHDLITIFMNLTMVMITTKMTHPRMMVFLMKPVEKMTMR